MYSKDHVLWTVSQLQIIYMFASIKVALDNVSFFIVFCNFIVPFCFTALASCRLTPKGNA